MRPAAVSCRGEVEQSHGAAVLVHHWTQPLLMFFGGCAEPLLPVTWNRRSGDSERVTWGLAPGIASSDLAEVLPELEFYAPPRTGPVSPKGPPWESRGKRRSYEVGGQQVARKRSYQRGS
eukprot:s259_g15.t1